MEFVTKPRQAQAMISQAIAAGVPFAWFTADETYGQAKCLQAWLEGEDVSYVMAIRCSDTFTMPAGEQRADVLIAAVPSRAWQRICTGAGAHGPREFDWARIPVQTGWRREECFQQAKGEAGLDHYQVRSWRAWYARITLSMLALAWLAASRAQAVKGVGTGDPGMIGYMLPEIRRLLVSLIQRHALDHETVWSWSRWRRRRQYQARQCHYRHRGYLLT